MNYNSPVFWVLFALVYLPYWRLRHRQQNTLLLVASYVFYGFWDYRFLFLILLSTFIDYVGGLGVAGMEVPRRQLRAMAGLLVGAAALLCTGIRYGVLGSALLHLDGRLLRAAWSGDRGLLLIPVGTALACLLYGAAIPRLYALPEARRRRTFLTISMVANLAILGFFKYFNFFVSSASAGLHSLGLGDMAVAPLSIVLPAGISFYTFQAMSYTIDIYRGNAQPTRSLADFALFVCFFPHLVAGPIMRAHTLLPQVIAPRASRTEEKEAGLLLVMIGLFKKLVIADNMAPIANSVFNRFAHGGAAALTGADVLVGVYAFAFQIYGDFSGYSSIARGISKWLGFELVVNFRMPYLAVSPADFWRRWHISLSTWLRDYLYIPLGGNRHGRRNTYRNLMITMLLGGLWHGASWTFVAWGLYHGIILCAFRLLAIQDVAPGESVRQRAHWLLRVVLMFHLTCIGWLLFRADSFQTVTLMAARLLTGFHVSGFTLGALAMIVFYCAPLFVLEWCLDGEVRLRRLLDAHWAYQGAAQVYIVVMLLVFHAEQTRGFIYFQF